MDKVKLEARRKTKLHAKELAIVEEHKRQKPIEKLIISIEWRKSRTWGHNPHAEAKVYFKDGTFIRQNGYTASGCGYDKESTVIAKIFNDFLRYKLYQKRELKSSINGEETNHPYGVYYYNGGVKQVDNEEGYIWKPGFNEGVGTSCYYKIGDFISGKFVSVASGKSFDVYQYTDDK